MNELAAIEEVQPREDLDDLVERFSVPEDLPPAEWLIRLRLEKPRRNLRCLSRGTRIVKRLFDIFFSATLLVFLSPLLFLVALAVRWTSPGPAIFAQLRVGLNLRRNRGDRRSPERPGPPPSGVPERRFTSESDRRRQRAYGRHFVLYKFRTMGIDAEKEGARFAVKGDARVTPLGRFLRRTRLDELPQLWNVLKGEMSVVGPRPERPEFIEGLSREVPGYLHRLGLKPGLTGLAQVLNGYDIDIHSFRKKVALDLLYLENCCLANDLKILWRTVGVVLTGKGAL
ncbi:MAG: sugar transferase [Planctomycetes bacterium]|nr:sugar transferase [Planctomycetota bacterium]